MNMHLLILTDNKDIDSQPRVEWTYGEYGGIALYNSDALDQATDLQIFPWQRQFPTEWEVPALLHTQFIDQSDGNDVCPSFVHPLADLRGNYARLMADHPEQTRRELGQAERYTVVIDTEGEVKAVWAGDDVEQAIQAMYAAHAQIAQKQ